MPTINDIKAAIADGDSELAIKQLVDYTEATDSPFHHRAILLLGQFKQWKRDKMMGVEHSNGELRRIEVAIMDILKEKSTPPSSNKTTQQLLTLTEIVEQEKSTFNWKPFAIGGAVVALLLLVWAVNSMIGKEQVVINENGNPVGQDSASDVAIGLFGHSTLLAAEDIRLISYQNANNRTEYLRKINGNWRREDDRFNTKELFVSDAATDSTLLISAKKGGKQRLIDLKNQSVFQLPDTITALSITALSDTITNRIKRIRFERIPGKSATNHVAFEWQKNTSWEEVHESNSRKNKSFVEVERGKTYLILSDKGNSNNRLKLDLDQQVIYKINGQEEKEHFKITSIDYQ